LFGSNRLDRLRAKSRGLVTFSIVGGIGFLVDAAVLGTLFHGFGLNVYGARLVSFTASVTSTWWLNRRWTFTPLPSGSKSNEYVRYLGVNGLGFIVNFSVYALCIETSQIMAVEPIFALAMGSISGLLFNYFGSRRFVFS
jgi:putative flippase GtrA